MIQGYSKFHHITCIGFHRQHESNDRNRNRPNQKNQFGDFEIQIQTL